MQQAIEILGPASRPTGSDESTARLGREGAVDARWSELGVPHAPALSEAWRERDLAPAPARLGEPASARA